MAWSIGTSAVKTFACHSAVGATRYTKPISTLLFPCILGSVLSTNLLVKKEEEEVLCAHCTRHVHDQPYCEIALKTLNPIRHLLRPYPGMFDERACVRVEHGLCGGLAILPDYYNGCGTRWR